MPQRHPSHRLSAIAGFIDTARLEALLEPWLPHARDRAFVTRCILEEGPVHHRGASFVLLALLGRLAAMGGTTPPAPGETLPIALRLPPHLAPGAEDARFPLGLPLRPLEVLAPARSPQLAEMADCLADGPPHHALANAAMMCFLDVLLERAGAYR